MCSVLTFWEPPHLLPFKAVRIVLAGAGPVATGLTETAQELLLTVGSS